MLQDSFLLALKKALKTKGIHYKMLADHLEISEASVKRVFSQGSLNLERISAILTWADISFMDIARLMDHGAKEERTVLTLEQEKVLSKNNELCAFLHFLLFGKTIRDLRKSGLFEDEMIEVFKRSLCSPELAAELPQGELRILVSRGVKWLPMGPMTKAYGEKLKQNFLNGNFEGLHAYNNFCTRSLSPASQTVIKRKIKALMDEVDSLAASDTVLAKEETEPVAFFFAMRPFYYDFGMAHPASKE